jgi:toxin-antitoxin system PIN domain toxin
VILCDVNVLTYAHKQGAPRHDEYHGWLSDQLRADEAFGVSDLILRGFRRVVTHPRIFDPPSEGGEARDFAAALRAADNAVRVEPGHRHWRIFQQLAEQSQARGNLIPDAYLAALAIESGAEWITTDRGFHRFPGLRWRHPLPPSPD